MDTFTLPKLRCLHCDHVWVPRVQSPGTCPKCRNANWDRSKKKSEKNKKPKDPADSLTFLVTPLL